jgi:hypothetical protein
MLVDLTLDAIREHEELLERAARFHGRPRERLIALAEAEDVFFRLHPQHSRVLQLVRVAAQLVHVDTARRNGVRACDSLLLGLMQKVFRDGVDCGDLVFDEKFTDGDAAFALWAMAFGTRALMSTHSATIQLAIVDGLESAQSATDLFLDALGWRPLSTEIDCASLRRRIRSEMFRREYERLAAA